MLKLLFVVGALLVGAALGFVLWRYWATRRASSRLQEQLMAELQPIWSAIYAGRNPDAEAVARSARNPATRVTLFDLLLFHHKLALFPAEYRMPIPFAESALVRWLMHPNELGCPPDKIELAESVMIPDGGERERQWLLFRFCTVAPHWAAEDGWMAGVVGPVSVSDGEAFPNFPVVWSMLRAFDSLTPEEHIQSCRQLLQKAGLHA